MGLFVTLNRRLMGALRSFLAILTFSLLFRTECLKIEFNPSQTLTQHSLFRWKSNINDFVIELLRNEELWPVLVAFSEAKYFNFSSLMANSINLMECKELLEVVQKPQFPLKQVFDAETFAWKAACFAKLPTETLLLAPNPLESSKFIPHKWSTAKLKLFANVAFYSNRSVDWIVLCSDSDVFDAFSRNDNVNFVWDLMNLDCFRLLSIDSVTLYLYKLSQDLYLKLTRAEISYDNRMTMNRGGMTSYFSNLFRSYTQGEFNFGIKFVMKIISIAAIMIKFPENISPISCRCKDILFENFTALSTNTRHKFPMRKKLIFIMRQLVHRDNRHPSSFLLISDTILLLIRGCKRRARASWLLRALTLWNHFRGTDYCHVSQFLDPFLKIFFDSEIQATAQETCQLFKFLNENISPEFTASTISSHLPFVPELAESVYNSCFKLIPRQLKSDSQIFPLDLRLSFVFKKLRRIGKSRPGLVEITTKECWINLILEFKDKMHLDRVLPINLRFIHEDESFLNFAQVIELFFNSILASTEWWIIQSTLTPTLNDQIVLVPSPTLPPQVLEFVGFMMARALSLNIKLPFIMDKTFWKLIDQFPQFPGPNFVPNRILTSLYHSKTDLQYDQQVFRVSNTLDLSLKSLFTKFLYPAFWLPLRMSVFPSFGVTTELGLFRIAWMGSKHLRAGINKAFPTDALHSAFLYELIFG